jgi:iron-sulfur cluster assembly accessory protein
MIEAQQSVIQPIPALEPETTPLVTLSEAAVAKLTELTRAEADPGVGLRVYVYSGGCSGYRYGMMLEDQPTAEDVKVSCEGINVYVDPQSTALLQGSEIDYVDTLMGAGFTVNNPNAVAGCGCGSSFRTAESVGSPGACGH